MTGLVHLHTALMVLWVLLLISQAWLIRAKQYRIHRWIGRSSFIIVPLIVLVTLMLSREALNSKPITMPAAHRDLPVGSGGPVRAGVGAGADVSPVYADPHAVVVSTIFAAGSAIVLRIIANWFAWLPGMNLAENPENFSNIAAANGAVLVLMLIGLIAVDWRLGIRRSPFWLLTVTTLITHIGFFTFAKSDWWMSFVLWFATPPS